MEETTNTHEPANGVYGVLANVIKVECSMCENGIRMCHRRPCWGTVEDFKKIIDAGFAKKLMIDYYNDESINNDERTYILSGANNGNECSKADWNPKGRCAFLTNENKCEIHYIKPTMGAVACCKREQPKFKQENDACVTTWATDEGKQLIEQWKKLVDYEEKDDDESFDLYSGLSAMLMGF